MRSPLFLTAVFLMLAGCSTGLDRQMEGVLDDVEGRLGYVNTLDTRDVARMTVWFEKHGSDDQKARALYCLGRNQFNDRGYSAAIVTYTQALEYAFKASDTLYIALISKDMARTCSASGNVPDEISYLSRAGEAFRAIGRPNESLQTILEIGCANAGLGKDDLAEGIFKSVLYDAHELRDTLLEARCLESYAELAVSKDTLDPVLAIDLLGRAANELEYPLSCSAKGILAYAYSLIGEKEESWRWLLEARVAAEGDEEAATVKFREYQIAARNGDSRLALAALEKVTEYSNKAHTVALEEAVAASQREYIENKAASQAEKLKAARTRLRLLLLVAVLIIASLVTFYLYFRSSQERKLSEETAEREKLMSLAEDLQKQLAATRFPPSDRSNLQFDALQRLCEQYYVYEGTDNLQPKILKEVKSIVSGLRSDRKTQKALEEMLDSTRDGVMTKLREEFPGWKQEDFLLYSFAASGFSSTTISTLMEKEKNVIYNRIWRLKGRISNSDSPEKEFFLRCLES